MPDSVGAAVLSPGTNLQMSSVRGPKRLKMDSVLRTQESGSSAMRQSRFSTTAPRRFPKKYQKVSLHSEASAGISIASARCIRPCPAKAPAASKQRYRRNGQSCLLDQDPHEEQGIAVMNYELERVRHSGSAIPELLDAMLPKRYDESAMVVQTETQGCYLLAGNITSPWPPVYRWPVTALWRIREADHAAFRSVPIFCLLHVHL